jgi:hypothetical protein
MKVIIGVAVGWCAAAAYYTWVATERRRWL